MTSTRRFAGRAESVTAVRRFVRDTLRDRSPEIVSDVELMASELATNCVRHAHTDFELTIHARGQIRVEVRDMNEAQPVVMSPTPEQLSGRGLRIVETMSKSWGTSPAPNGKTVWFVL